MIHSMSNYKLTKEKASDKNLDNKYESNNSLTPEKFEFIDSSIDTITIDDECFSSCNFIKVVLPDRVKSIGSKSFERCNKLVDVSFGSNSKLTSINTEAFFNCVQLNHIVFPESLKK